MTPVAGAPPTPNRLNCLKEAKAPVIPTQPAKAVSPTKPDEVKSPPSLPRMTKRPGWQSLPLHRLLPLIPDE